MKINTKNDRRVRIQLRQRKRIAGTGERPRLTVFRSVTHIYAQVIDDMSGTTIVSAASTEPALKAEAGSSVKGGNRAGAQALGKTIAERLIAKGIKRVVFDRGGYLYHGRIRAVAEAARGGNLAGAEAIGKVIAERSIEKGIKRVVFDRSGFLYHGRIRAVADAARKAGLEF